MDMSCLLFDGMNDFVNLGSPASLALGSNFTWEMWVHPEAVGSLGLFGLASAPQWYIAPSGTTKQQFIGIGAQGNPQSNTPLPLNEWRHVAVVHSSAGTASFFLNGVPDGNGATSSGFSGVARQAKLGQNPDDATLSFNGRMAEIRIWSVQRTAAQIKANFARQIAPQANMVAYWRGDEGAGTVLRDLKKGVDGTLTNGLTYLATRPPILHVHQEV